MNSTRSLGSDGALGVLATLTGLGVVTIALAPLALPILILTLAALLPFLVPIVALAIPVAIVLAVRAVVRRLTPTRRDRDNRGRTQWRSLHRPDTSSAPGTWRTRATSTR
jgi:hypothetical protein